MIAATTAAAGKSDLFIVPSFLHARDDAVGRADLTVSAFGDAMRTQNVEWGTIVTARIEDATPIVLLGVRVR